MPTITCLLDIAATLLMPFFHLMIIMLCLIIYLLMPPMPPAPRSMLAD